MSKQKFILVLLVFLLVAQTTLNFKPVSAQSLSSLSSEVFSLKAKLNQLENQVQNLKQTRSPQPYNPPLAVPQSPPNPSLGRSDPMFERLATLLIELKERVTALEKRTTELEKNS